MKRSIALVILLLVVAILLVACQEPEPTPDYCILEEQKEDEQHSIGGDGLQAGHHKPGEIRHHQAEKVKSRQREEIKNQCSDLDKA